MSSPGHSSDIGPAFAPIQTQAGNSEVVVHDISLSEDDVPVLMKILAGVNHKWELISIALGLSQAVIEECRSGNSNAVRLHNVLCEWVTGKHQIPATLSNLKQQLASELVGVAIVALDLEERFRKAKIPHVAVPEAKRPPLDSTLKILVPLIILVIAIMISRVHFNNNIIEEVLTVSVPPEKKHLQMLYSKDIAEVPPDSWPPPVNNRNFINLTLIKKNIQDADDDYRVPGDMDDTIESKEKVSYEEVFGEYERGGLVLVEGRPGSGKTTLLYKLTRDWAIRGDMLKNATMVFLIPLRSLAIRKAENLSDILELFYNDHEELREKVSGDIKRSKGEGMCFLIDGLDEYYPQDENNSVIHQLLYEKTYLPAAMVIVASRPVTTQKLKHQAQVTRRIEVCGFTKEHIFEYVAKYQFSSDLSKSATLASKLKEYLNLHINILHMCYLPVHAAMICFLHSNLKGDIPQTMTGIYEKTTRLIILRKLTRSDDDAQLLSLDGLHGKDKEYFRTICQLAFDMTINKTQVVLGRDTKVPPSNGTNDAPSLGLVTIDRTAQLYGLDNSYTFLHLTFQEYLAALYLAKLKDDQQQMEMIREHAGKKHMQMVWKFYCGTVKKQAQVIVDLLMDEEYPDLYKIQCAFESQQQFVCDIIVKRTGALDLGGYTLTPADLTALAYVISTTSHPVIELYMDRCHLHADHVREFLKKVSNKQLKCIQTLRLSYNNIGDDGAAALAERLMDCSNLKTLELESNNIGDDGAAALAEGLKSCSNLQTLWLFHNNIGAFGAEALAEGVKSCTNLQMLWISYNNIGDKGTAALAAVLKNLSNLHTLALYNNNIGDDGVAALAEGIKSCTSLQELHLQNNTIGDDGAAALAKGLKSCTNLQALWLSGNHIGDDGAVALAEELKAYTNLRLLWISYNNIGDKGTIALAKVLKLKYLSNLHILGLNGNNIGDDGALALAEGLKSYTNLRMLCISYNNIGDEGTAALEFLKRISNLHILGRHGNNIIGDDLAALAEGGLKSCSNPELYLQNNTCSDYSAAALAKALESCNNLQMWLDNKDLHHVEAAVYMMNQVEITTSKFVLSASTCEATL